MQFTTVEFFTFLGRHNNKRRLASEDRRRRRWKSEAVKRDDCRPMRSVVLVSRHVKHDQGLQIRSNQAVIIKEEGTWYTVRNKALNCETSITMDSSQDTNSIIDDLDFITSEYHLK